MTLTILDSKGGKIWSNSERIPTGKKTNPKVTPKVTKPVKPMTPEEKKQDEKITVEIGTLQGNAMKLFSTLINKQIMKIAGAKELCMTHMGVDKPIMCEDSVKLKAYIQAAQDLLR